MSCFLFVSGHSKLPPSKVWPCLQKTHVYHRLQSAGAKDKVMLVLRICKNTVLTFSLWLKGFWKYIISYLTALTLPLHNSLRIMEPGAEAEGQTVIFVSRSNWISSKAVCACRCWTDTGPESGLVWITPISFHLLCFFSLRSLQNVWFDL